MKDTKKLNCIPRVLIETHWVKKLPMYRIKIKTFLHNFVTVAFLNKSIFIELLELSLGCLA